MRVLCLLLLSFATIANCIPTLRREVPINAIRRPTGTQAFQETWKPNRVSDTATDASTVSVTDFGAKGDGTTDNTAAFQKAISSLTTGGIVLVPAGQYKFTGILQFTAGVSLKGTYLAPPSHPGAKNMNDGSILMPTAGRGNETSTPFITLVGDCSVQGVVIYYPEQVPDQVPAPYPWTISMTGNNNAVMDVELLNSYNGISCVQAARHFIARVQGQPTNIGIIVDANYDIGRIDNVHWNPWYSPNPTYMSWQLQNGRGFVFARSDWEYVLNTFCFAYSIGYHFISSKTGECNGNFLGIGADMSVNASVQVDAIQPMGLQITNGEFTSFITPQWGNSSAESTQVIVNAKSGDVRFTNCAFWGPSYAIAKLNGGGLTGFSDCTFVQWDVKKQGTAAVIATGGQVMVQNSHFMQDSLQVSATAAVTKAIVTGNMVKGDVKMNIAAGQQEVSGNL